MFTGTGGVGGMASSIGGWHTVSGCSIDGPLSAISVLTDLIYFLQYLYSMFRKIPSFLFGQVVKLVFTLKVILCCLICYRNLLPYLPAMTSLSYEYTYICVGSRSLSIH